MRLRALRWRRSTARALAALGLLGLVACGSEPAPQRRVVTLPGSAVGEEAALLREQLRRFARERPDIEVVLRRTPDAADQRRQLYVQWLNAGADDPDVLQLDVVWTPEFAAAGWILPLERFQPQLGEFFATGLEANRWAGALYALPWFVDVALLYWRNDLLEAPPASYAQLQRAAAARARAAPGLEHGWVWQGALYEGLVVVFLEQLAARGGAILDAAGAVAVDSPAALEALRALREAIEGGATPRDVLTWQEEQTRFAFQNGRALFMRNWPYAYALLRERASSRVAGAFGVAPLPGPAVLGGSQLAINARSDQPEASWAVIDYLTRPAQMLERARRVGQLPARASLYADPSLGEALPLRPEQLRAVLDRAVARPGTPVYAQLSAILQVHLHRALSGQSGPEAALAAAARALRELFEKTALAPPAGGR
jgi:multiple sugar transport system substrate-binding protein